MRIEKLTSEPQFIPLEGIPFSEQPIRPVRSEGDSTISSASSSSDDQSTCCVWRCWIYVKSQMTQFCEWLCSFFSSQPVTVEMLRATGDEMNALMKEKMALVERAYQEKCDAYSQAHGDSEEAVYCCFAHAIQLSNKVLQVVEIMEKWGEAITHVSVNSPSLVKSITQREMESDKREILRLIPEIESASRTPIPPECTAEIRALVKEDCLSRESRRFLFASGALLDEYVRIREEIKDLIIQKYLKDYQAMVNACDKRYCHISLDSIRTDGEALCYLADANTCFILIGQVFESDISERAVQAKLAQLSLYLNGPICTKMTPELEQALIESASSSNSPKWDLARAIAFQTQCPDQVERRLQEVLDKIAKPVYFSTSVEDEEQK